jgi:SAM-dependent methyltransferase
VRVEQQVPKRPKRRPANGKRPKKKLTMADKADRHVLYERSVQDPTADIEFLEGIFEERFGRPPRHVREDFCGTALMSAEWVTRHGQNRVWGVDLDPDPLESGRRRHLAKLDDDQRARVELIQADVRDSGAPQVDVVLAMNFSYCIFASRDELRDYFARAREGLKDEGLLILDIYGGPDAQRAMRDKHSHKKHTYVWHQKSYDPITARSVCHIHFRFPDGSKMNKAFTYDWRLWTIPELVDLLREAGFARSDVYWEGPGEDGTGDGVFLRKTSVENEDAWIAYVVAGR